MNTQRYLAISLFAIALVFVAWALCTPHTLAGLFAFATPPMLLALLALRGVRRIGFFSSLFALLWFSHGVMTAWSAADMRFWALAEIALALVVIHAACLPGIQAYFARRGAR